ncbi:MAG: AAA family ATPase [Treponema sp.]|nr:AAA family ATPase [Treponema sp.]MBR7080427.1 AAA family ATPase [Treponema sp.]
MYNEQQINSNQYEMLGATLEDCKRKLYDKYQERYQILTWKAVLKPGILGFGQKELVKVTYIIDDRLSYASPKQYSRSEPAYYGRPMPSSPYAEIQDKSGYIREIPTVNNVQPKPLQDSFTSNRDEIIKKLTEGSNVTNMLQVANLSKQIEKITEKLDKIEQAANGRSEHPSILKVDEALESNDFTRSFIEKINAHIKSALTYEQLDDYDLVQNTVIDFIADSIQIAPKFNSKGRKNAHVIIIVGPTGVGKTTTIAKMAAKLKVTAKEQKIEPPKILMVTVDKMRVGAEEQLSHWGNIMDVEVRKGSEQGDLKEIYDSYKTDMDFILVDTSGYSPRDLENIAKMHSLLDVDGMKADVYLAITADCKASDLENIIRNYESFDFRSVIVTKCDQTMSFGNVLSVLIEKNKAISMVADGQQVLHTLQRAHPLCFLKYMKGFNVDREHIIEKYGPEEGSEKNDEK